VPGIHADGIEEVIVAVKKDLVPVIDLEAPDRAVDSGVVPRAEEAEEKEKAAAEERRRKDRCDVPVWPRPIESYGRSVRCRR
jgi:hypothetical protein